MSTSLGAAAVGALASLVFTGRLVRRCVRVPRLATLALFFTMAGLSVALVAMVLGYDRGFGPTTFRAVQLGAQLVAPIALTWALAELTGKSLGSRFAARLALGALTVIGGVVLATDPLSSAAFSKAWPAASVHYQLIPNWVLEVIAVATAVFAVVAVIVAGVRGRQSAGWRTLFLAVAAVAAASVATDWLRATLSVNSAYPVICLVAVALTWFGAARAGAVRLESLRSGGFAWDEDTGSFVRYHEDTGEFGYGADTGGFARDRGGNGWHGDDTGGFRRDPADTDFSGWFRPGEDTGGFRRDAIDRGVPAGGADTGYGRYGMAGQEPEHTGAGHGQNDTAGLGAAGLGAAGLGAAGLGAAGFGAAAHGAPQGAPGAVSYVETGHMMAVVDGEEVHFPAQATTEDTSRLYGQIAIYTLLDETAEEFERLASEVVEQVRTREPNTLVYVMHGVPAAPMQRILYAVYRDEAAFDEHERQPYIRQFEEEREPYVLATNVIELGVRHAKFAAPGGAKRVPRVRKARPRGTGGR